MPLYNEKDHIDSLTIKVTFDPEIDQDYIRDFIDNMRFSYPAGTYTKLTVNYLSEPKSLPENDPYDEVNQRFKNEVS